MGIPLEEGKNGEITVTVKEVKEKVLPSLDDELATASEFETLAELRRTSPPACTTSWRTSSRSSFARPQSTRSSRRRRSRPLQPS